MRVLALLCPDWPVVAAALDSATDLDRRVPVVVLAHNADNQVFAANEPARADGIRRGMRRRDAQSRCPEAVLVPGDPDRDVRVFEQVLNAVEALRPGVAPLRPGLLAVRSPARFYGGDDNAAAVLVEAVVAAGVWDVRVGVADDLPTAVQAAHLTGPQQWQVIPEGGSAVFWRDLPLGWLVAAADQADDLEQTREFVSVLRRLGLRRVGDLAALPAADVSARFGARGARLHRLIRGHGPRLLAERTPPPELAAEVAFEPPLDSSEAVCFSVRRTCEQFVAGLDAHNLVATGVRIEVETDNGTRQERLWAHARWFAAVDLVDRVHWQLQAAARWGLLDAPVRRVSFVPQTVEPAADHAETLYGGGSDERVERGVAKVQAMLGYDAVRRPVRQGGRSPADRQALVPWGDRPGDLRPLDLPWPGSIPPPAPCRVLPEAVPSAVLGEQNLRVRVTERGLVSGVPTRFRTPDGWQRVQAWAGPWPVEEAWWGQPRRLIARFQMVGSDGRAWLLRYEAGDWLTEAGYD